MSLNWIKASLIFGVFAFVISSTSCKKDNTDNNSQDTCTVTTISFLSDIDPILASKCAFNPSCHGQSSANGDYTTYQGVKTKVDLGVFNTRVFINKDMPQTGSLSPCEFDKLKFWFDQGAPNN